jgi:hypothetical protein
MRQPNDRSLAAALAPDHAASFGALLRRLLIAGVILAGVTVLASIALAF